MGAGACCAAARSPGQRLAGYYGVQLAARPRPVLLPPRPRRAPPPRPAARARSARSRRPACARPWYPCWATTTSWSPARSSRRPRRPERSAVGDQALWELPRGLIAPARHRADRRRVARRPAAARPREPVPRPARWPDPRSGCRRIRPPRAARRDGRPPSASEPPRGRRRAPPASTTAWTSDASLRLIVLDLARRGGGSGGLVRPDQPGWLASQLEPRRRGEPVGDRRLAPAAGRLRGRRRSCWRCSTRASARDRGAVRPHPPQPDRAAAAHYWLISTASLIDYPQQARALRVLRDRRRRRRDPDLDARPHLPGDLGDDLPPARLPRRAGRPAAGVRRRPRSTAT